MLPLHGDLGPWQVLERGHPQPVLDGRLGAHRTPHRMHSDPSVPQTPFVHYSIRAKEASWLH